MKTISYIFRVISSIILLILSFAFIVIEGCMLVSCDFLLYESRLLASLQIYIRLLLAIGAFLVALFSILKREISFIIIACAMLIISLVIAPFISNGFGLYITLATALFAASMAFEMILARRSSKDSTL